MVVDRKALYEKRVQETVIKLADFMIFYSKNNVMTMSASEIRKRLNLTVHLFNEASGRLKAIGFHSGVKQFTKKDLKERNDNCKYYYLIIEERHPLKLTSEEIDYSLKQRQKTLQRNRDHEIMAINLALSEFKHNE